MRNKTMLGLVALAFTILNVSIVFGANEPYKNIYSIVAENPDQDLDGTPDKQDKCLGSSGQFLIINKNTSKQKAILPLGGAYLRLKKISDTSATFQTSTGDTFKSAVKSYNVAPGKISVLDGVKRRIRVLYSNTQKGFVLVWVGLLEGSVKGCDVNESTEKASQP